MYDLWFSALSTGHVKRVPVHGMQGPLEKQKSKASILVAPLYVLSNKAKNKKAAEFIFSVALWVVYILLDKEKVNRIPPQPRH
jgi:hypothetical protein